MKNKKDIIFGFTLGVVLAWLGFHPLTWQFWAWDIPIVILYVLIKDVVEQYYNKEVNNGKRK